MADFSLDAEMNIEIFARFIEKGADAGLTGSEYTVRLFDKDFFENDFLGESGLDHNGYAKISFNPSAFGNLGNIEKYPDLYFVLYKNGQVIFKSKVMHDFDFSDLDQYKKGEGEVVDLGTYLVEA